MFPRVFLFYEYGSRGLEHWLLPLNAIHVVKIIKGIWTV